MGAWLGNCAQGKGKAFGLNEPLKRIEKERRDRNRLSKQRCALYRKWMHPAVPSIQLCPETLPAHSYTHSWPLQHPQAAFIGSHSSIFFSLRWCLKPTNYHQLPPDGLHRCSRFSCPFKLLCINKPVVTNKKGGERWLFKAPLREGEWDEAHV